MRNMGRGLIAGRMGADMLDFSSAGSARDLGCARHSLGMSMLGHMQMDICTA